MGSASFYFNGSLAVFFPESYLCVEYMLLPPIKKLIPKHHAGSNCSYSPLKFLDGNWSCICVFGRYFHPLMSKYVFLLAENANKVFNWTEGLNKIYEEK